MSQKLHNGYKQVADDFNSSWQHRKIYEEAVLLKSKDKQNIIYTSRASTKT